MSNVPSAVTPLDEVARTLVVVGDTRDPALGERAAAWATERGHPIVAEPFGTAALRADNAAPTGVQLKVEEEQSKDTENTHPEETVGYLALDLAD